MRTRMQNLSTPPLVERDLSLTALHRPSSSATASHPQSRRQTSVTPSPPPSESVTPVEPASPPHTPMTQASDSSASSSCTRYNDHAAAAAFRRQASASPTFTFRAQPPAGHQARRRRPSLANKRVLSEGEVILPRPAKKSRMPHNTTLRKRSCGALQSLSFVPSAPAIASWRKACEQRRQRQHAKRNEPVVAAPRPEQQASQASPTKADVLPELRLLSATRTAPIGWSQFTGASTFMPHKVEVYDERIAKRTPERQRFWPIIDHQLDYTGARMLSLSNTSACLDQQAKALFDAPISPKSRVPLARCGRPLSLEQQSRMPAYTQPMGSSDEDRPPLTPDAPTRCVATRTPPRRASQYARDAAANESRRTAKIPLSPEATLSAVIDFTRAQAGRSQQQQAPRNVYGQLIHSPPSPPLATAVKPDLAAHAPLRIAPHRSIAAAAGLASDLHRSRDYFGHWEAYLCNFGKESTF